MMKLKSNLKLISLEHRKNNLKPYFYGVLGIFIFTIFIGILLSAIPIMEPNNEQSQMFATFDGLIPMITVISLNAFVILSSVMYSKFVVEEYTGKKSVLLFTYPQKRSEILTAKFILIFFFTFVSMMISNIIAIVIVGVVGNATGLILEPINTSIILNILYNSIIFSMMANLICIIALRAGFLKKSIVWTIVTAIILSAPFGNLVALLGNNLLLVILVVSIILFVSCIILFLGLLNKVNRMECL